MWRRSEPASPEAGFAVLGAPSQQASPDWSGGQEEGITLLPPPGGPLPLSAFSLSHTSIIFPHLLTCITLADEPVEVIAIVLSVHMITEESGNK